MLDCRLEILLWRSLPTPTQEIDMNWLENHSALSWNYLCPIFLSYMISVIRINIRYWQTVLIKQLGLNTWHKMLLVKTCEAKEGQETKKRTYWEVVACQLYFILTATLSHFSSAVSNAECWPSLSKLTNQTVYQNDLLLSLPTGALLLSLAGLLPYFFYWPFFKWHPN